MKKKPIEEQDFKTYAEYANAKYWWVECVILVGIIAAIVIGIAALLLR